jgi:hypothetical protein
VHPIGPDWPPDPGIGVYVYASLVCICSIIVSIIVIHLIGPDWPPDPERCMPVYAYVIE